jgi:hypothetical protein
VALNGLRISEALGADITAMGIECGHRTLTVLRKGGPIQMIVLALHDIRWRACTRSGAADATNPRPRIILEALTDLDRPGAQPWLELLHDEQLPLVLSTRASSKVVWSSIWTKRRDAVIELDLPSDGRSGTDLSWTLFVDDPAPDDASVAHMRKRRTCSSMLTFGTHSASSRLDWLSNRTMSSTGVRTDPSIWNTTIDIKTNTESVLCAVS